MKPVRFVMYLMAALVISVTVALILKQDPGSVMIHFRGYVIEMSLAILLCGVLLLYMIVRFAIWAWQLPRAAGQKMARRRQRTLFEKGLLALHEGDWSRAEEALNRAALKSSNPAINYLAAARAAHSQAAPDRGENYLALADRSGGADFGVNLTRAQWLLEEQKGAEAREILEALRKQRPKHPQVLRLLLQTYQESADHAAIKKLLSHLRRSGAVDSSALGALEQQIATFALEGAEEPGTLQQIWKSLGKTACMDPENIRRFADKALMLGDGRIAQKSLELALEADWCAQLIELYGKISGDGQRGRLNHAETWLEARPTDADLLLALGRMCIREELWGKARDYLQAALGVAPSVDGYALLCEVAEEAGAAEFARVAGGNAVRLVRGLATHELPPWVPTV